MLSRLSLASDARVVHQKSTLKAPQKPPQQAPQHSAEDKPRNEFNLDPRKGQLKQEVAEENALRDAGTTGVDKREDKGSSSVWPLSSASVSPIGVWCRCSVDIRTFVAT